ncbi:MAG: hypothetical protein KDK41_10365 [Leptospiraceae bacterium]|nr:hypothetical protein [Leptospiraceae bacterium]
MNPVRTAWRKYNREDCTIRVGVRPGFEAELALEMNNLGLPSTVHDGYLELKANLRVLPVLLKNLFCAENINVLMDAFLVKSYPELFDRVQRIPWENILGQHGPGKILVSTTHSRLHHTDNIANSIQEAIVKRLGLKSGDHSALADVCIQLENDRASLLASIGRGLYKRDYRPQIGVAPFKPTIAAALLLWAKTGQSAPALVWDPFCGSGTFLLEAAAMSVGESVPHDIDWQKLPFFTKAVPSRIERKQMIALHGILASDLDPGAILDCQKNFKNLTHRLNKAGAKELPFTYECEQNDFLNIPDELFDKRKKANSENWIIANLPYDERISVQADFFEKVAKKLKRCGGGWQVLLIVPPFAEKHFRFLLNQREKIVLSGKLKLKALTGKID